MRTETARSFSRRFSATGLAEVQAVLSEMDGQTRSELTAEGVGADAITSVFEIDVRYEGQAFEVPLVVTPEELASGGLEEVIARFNEEHLRLFTFNMDSPHELVNLRAIALGPVLDLPAPKLPEGNGDPIAAKLRDHELWVDGAMRPAVIYDRALLRANDRIEGPAIVIEMDSTTLIEADCIGIVDASGNILINLR